MHLLTKERLDYYLRSDPILASLNAMARDGDENFISHKWLLESPGKRLMYHELYGDLLSPESPRYRILDVGGGFTSLSRALMEKHVYWLLEINAHDTATRLRNEEKINGKAFWIDGDWYHHENSETWDIVIANDLFPNVDQRLSLFLEKYTASTEEMRLSLTYYDHTKFYLTRRMDGEEILCVLAWNGAQTLRALRPYMRNVRGRTRSSTWVPRSIFPNGRQVLIVNLAGQAKSY